MTVSSDLHERGEIDVEDRQHERSDDPWDAYAQSKLANVLFAYELERRLRAADAPATSVAVHPGYANARSQFRGPERRGQRLRRALTWQSNAVLAQSVADGALPMLYAATAPSAEGGGYGEPDGFTNMRGPPERQGSAEVSYDRETAGRLWEVSAELAGVGYDLPWPDGSRETETDAVG